MSIQPITTIQDTKLTALGGVLGALIGGISSKKKVSKIPELTKKDKLKYIAARILGGAGTGALTGLLADNVKKRYLG